jgi:hypothetical protein
MHAAKTGTSTAQADFIANYKVATNRPVPQVAIQAILAGLFAGHNIST